MGKDLDLVHMIKSGVWQEVNRGTDLFGQPIIERGYLPVNFAYLDDYCNKNGLTEQDLADAICKHGNINLILQALQATRNIEAYGKAWLKLYKGNSSAAFEFLAGLGATEAQLAELRGMQTLSSTASERSNAVIDLFDGEEGFVKFYLLGDKKRLWRFIKSKKVTARPKESLVAKAFNTVDIHLQNYANVFEQIENPKVFADVCWSVLGDPIYCTNSVDYNLDNDTLFKGLEMLATYYKKFDDPTLMDDFMAVIFDQLKNFKYNNRQLKQYGGKSVNEMLDERVTSLYRAVFESKLPTLKKVNFFMHNNFKGKNNDVILDTKHLQNLRNIVSECGNQLGREYMLYLGGQNAITTGNRQNYNILGYLEWDQIQCLYSHTVARSFNQSIVKEIIWAALDMLKEGYVQEFIKFMYVNGSQALEKYKYNEVYKIGDTRKSQIMQKYLETDSYKNIPVPFDYLWDYQVSKRTPKYPFFILARNAEKQPGFAPEMLAEPIFWEDGFDGSLFEEKNRQWKQEHGFGTWFSSYPMTPNFWDIYHNKFMLPKDMQRMAFEQKYFKKADDNTSNLVANCDDSEQEQAFIGSMDLTDYDPMADPKNVAAEQENYNARLDVDELEASEPELDDYGEEVEYGLEDISLDENWAEDWKNRDTEEELNEDWHRFMSIITSKPYNDDEQQEDDSQDEYDKDGDGVDPNLIVYLRQYLEQKLREDGYTEECIADVLEDDFSQESLLDMAAGYLEEDAKTEEEVYSNKALEEVQDKLQQDIQEYDAGIEQVPDNSQLPSDAPFELKLLWQVFNHEKQDAQEDNEVDYQQIDSALQELIASGEYEKAEEHLQELMGEPEKFDDLIKTSEGISFLIEAYKTNHENWGIPTNKEKDEDSPYLSIPF